ncbi:MAG: YggS family pyridoxal phosphate-dependent enzyme [bacterium]
MIKENVKKIIKEIPGEVELVGAAKTRTAEEIEEAIDGGLKIIGQNYLQEAEKVYSQVNRDVRWHFIGHLQRNKVKDAVKIFDMIQSLDSCRLAREVDKRCRRIDKVMPVLVEVNSGREEQKYGIMPENTMNYVKEISALDNIKIMGLMTMGPRFGEPENSRPFFKITREIFEKLNEENIPGVQMEYLSMGMTNSFKIALEEGANMIRLGTKIFGEREE